MRKTFMCLLLVLFVVPAASFAEPLTEEQTETCRAAYYAGMASCDYAYGVCSQTSPDMDYCGDQRNACIQQIDTPWYCGFWAV